MKYWLKAKQYGYGWYPATWQGWLVILVFVALMISNALRIDSIPQPEGYIPTNFILQTIVLVVLLIIICYNTSEPAKWRWGVKDKKHESKE
jgi:hypothetical protein